MNFLSILFVPGGFGTWYAGEPPDDPFGEVVEHEDVDFAVGVSYELHEGEWGTGLPEGTPTFDDQFDRALQHLRTHFDWQEDEPVQLALDPTTGWVTDDARREFLRIADEIENEVSEALGDEWSVRVSRQLGQVSVRLMGEYSCTWPLWVGGLTGPEDWPQLSEDLIVRLTDWAVRADPDHEPKPGAEETEALRQEVADCLPGHFTVTAIL